MSQEEDDETLVAEELLDLGVTNSAAGSNVGVRSSSGSDVVVAYRGSLEDGTIFSVEKRFPFTIDEGTRLVAELKLRCLVLAALVNAESDFRKGLVGDPPGNPTD